jgi:hypothetical protein
MMAISVGPSVGMSDLEKNHRRDKVAAYLHSQDNPSNAV